MTKIDTAGAAVQNKVLFRTPSYARLRRLLVDTRSKSILRSLEYERLQSLQLRGRVLDFGGGSKTHYSGLIASWADSPSGFAYESANIDPNTQPTFLIPPDGEIPCEDSRYDVVISLNTFEHVYGVSGTLARIHRVLKPGGELVFIVPFLFRVHGHPNDYSRGTPSFWRTILAEHAFTGVAVEALNWGPFSTGTTVSGTPGPLKRLRIAFALLLDLLYFSRRYGPDVILTEEQDSPVCNAAFGYFIRCTKPDEASTAAVGTTKGKDR